MLAGNSLKFCIDASSQTSTAWGCVNVSRKEKLSNKLVLFIAYCHYWYKNIAFQIIKKAKRGLVNFCHLQLCTILTELIKMVTKSPLKTFSSTNNGFIIIIFGWYSLSVSNLVWSHTMIELQKIFSQKNTSFLHIQRSESILAETFLPEKIWKKIFLHKIQLEQNWTLLRIILPPSTSLHSLQ